MRQVDGTGVVHPSVVFGYHMVWMDSRLSKRLEVVATDGHL